MAHNIIDRVGDSAHIGNNEAHRDINNFIILRTSGRLDDFIKRLEGYLLPDSSHSTRRTNLSQSSLLQLTETSIPPQDRDLWETIQELLKSLISACQQCDDIDSQDLYPLHRLRETLDGLDRRFGEPVALNQSELSPGEVSPVQVTCAPATPIPETSGSATPGPATLSPTTPIAALASQTGIRRTSVESCVPNLSKVTRSSAQSLKKILLDLSAEIVPVRKSEPLMDAMSRFTYSHNSSDASMEIKKRSPTFSMETIFRITPGQKVETLHLDCMVAHLECHDPIRIAIVGEKAKDAVTEWVKSTFGKRNQKWNGDYTDIRITSSYGTPVWNVTFRLYVPKKLQKAEDLENLRLDLAVYFFDKADAKTLKNVAQHFKTRTPSWRVLLGLDSANELTKPKTQPPGRPKYDIEPVYKGGVEKALEDSGAAFYIECARSHDVALMRLFSILFCVALSARQKSGRRSSR